MPGSAMPAWNRLLADADIDAVLGYIKSLSSHFASEQPKVVTLGSPVASTPQSVARGRPVYEKLKCTACHGTDGRGAGAVQDTFEDDWKQPLRAPVTRWSTQLHDRFMLPTFVRMDLQDVLAELREAGYELDPAWFAPHFEFRFPMVGQVRSSGIELTLRNALEHYDAAWRYTLAIPRAERRMRLACAWPLLIGLRTLDLLAASPNWLDPAVTLKVPRVRVYGLMAHSLGTVWSTRALGRQARRLRERIRP